MDERPDPKWLTWLAVALLIALLVLALFLSLTAPVSAATLRLSGTAPNLLCDGTASPDSIEFVQVFWIDWAQFNSMGFQQWRLKPGEHFQLYRTVNPGSYTVIYRVLRSLSGRTIFSCPPNGMLLVVAT
jgi:hypothetical protein